MTPRAEFGYSTYGGKYMYLADKVKADIYHLFKNTTGNKYMENFKHKTD